MIELYCPGFSFITVSRVAGSVCFSPDSGTVPRSPPFPEVSRIFGIFHRQRRKIVAAIQAVGDHLDLLAGVRFVLRLVVLVMGLRIGRRSHHDLRQVDTAVRSG